MDVKVDYKESWVQKNWCFWTVVLEKTLASPLDCKEIQPVHPKGNQSWVFIGRTDVEAETPILWLPDAKSWLIGKDPDAGKDWGQEEKSTTGWDGWMASPTQRTWVWVNSGSWWWAERPGVLQSMGSQRVKHDWATELNWTENILLYNWYYHNIINQPWKSERSDNTFQVIKEKNCQTRQYCIPTETILQESRWNQDRLIWGKTKIICCQQMYPKELTKGNPLKQM